MNATTLRWLLLTCVATALAACGAESSPSAGPRRADLGRTKPPTGDGGIADTATERDQPANTAGTTNHGCVLQILQPHHPIPSSDGRIRGHIGVDFAVCADQHIIAIGDGVVVEVSSDPGFGPEANGGFLSIVHDVPGGFVRLYMYFHFSQIVVHEGDRVSRGQILGDAWTIDDPEWVPHVHLQQLGSEPIDEKDPLKTLGRCLSRARSGQLVYPIPC